ncbi:hypothetical protein STBA_28790 [Streptomyces sp. MP131-18]|nr:hypothetical protein STBA_28790 [Streptomyces sp. MP131-18]
MWLHDSGASNTPGLPARRIRTAVGPTPEQRRDAETFAYPDALMPSGMSAEQARQAQRQGARAFTLWRDAKRSEVLAHVVTLTAVRGRGATYEVLDAAGGRLALITRTPAGLFRRTRWAVTTPAQAGEAVGRKGPVRLWIPWWICALTPTGGVLLLWVLAMLTTPP